MTIFSEVLEVVREIIENKNLNDEQDFSAPDNSVFASLYGGEKSEGAKFLDDPIIKTKVLTLPKLGLKIIFDGKRLRIDEQKGEEPQKSILVKEVFEIKQKLFGEHPLSGFGFNFGSIKLF